LEKIEAITLSVEKVDHVKAVRSATQPAGTPIKNFLVPNQAHTLDDELKQANNAISKIASGLNDAHKQLKHSEPQLEKATGSIDVYNKMYDVRCITEQKFFKIPVRTKTRIRSKRFS